MNGLPPPQLGVCLRAFYSGHASGRFSSKRQLALFLIITCTYCNKQAAPSGEAAYLTLAQCIDFSSISSYDSLCGSSDLSFY